MTNLNPSEKPFWGMSNPNNSSVNEPQTEAIHPEIVYDVQMRVENPLWKEPQTEAIQPEILYDEILAQEMPQTDENQSLAVTDHKTTNPGDWFNLARKLRGQNQELLETVVQLESALATSRQQLREQIQRSRKIELEKVDPQEQSSHLLEQLKASQDNNQRQKSQIGTLIEQLNTIQQQFAQLERECALIKEEYQDKNNQLIISQRQVGELQTRLHRQQRYTLQYKAALDECLSNCATKAQTQTPAIAQSSGPILDPKIMPIQPWSNQGQSPDESESSVSVSPKSISSIDETLEELFNITQEMPEIAQNSERGRETSQESPGMMVPSRQSLVMNSPVPFSFSIERKKDAAKAKVNLPSFLNRH
ncbi:hypothetical protein [Aphanothece sacrum]|nr:hypothetical protein [Aphanothece sacrum]